jgi:uncharacterized membrane protein
MNIAVQSSEIPTAYAAGRRAVALDVLRILAIFQMVQGHTIDAVLADVHRSGLLHGVWQSARGLTSVAFLFLAGVGFAFATRSERGRDAWSRARRGRRALLLIALGYAMRAPAALLVGPEPTSTAIAALWARFAVVDVLQCIGVTLLALDAMIMLVPDARRRSITLGVLGGVLLALGPLAAQIDPSGPLRPLLAYATSNGGSLFPLLPWAAHALIGSALGPLFFARDARRVLGLGVGLGVLGALLVALHPALGQVARIGCVLVVSAGLLFIEPVLGRCPRWLLALAPHSLLIYLLHVVLAYGERFGLKDVVGHTLGPLASIGVALAMLGLCALVALGYERRPPKPALAAGAAPG